MRPPPNHYRYLPTAFLGLLLIAAGCFSKQSSTVGNLTSPPSVSSVSTLTNSPVNTNVAAVVNSPAPKPAVVVPIQGFFSRVTKKPFGIYITPKTSPVQPEKFTGYHTGTDAETTSAEANIDIPIFSIAKGTVVFAGHVNGYGGVIMIRYTIDKETVTALFGHLRIASFTVKVGQSVSVGQKIALLGAGYTSETDGERKHLHFGIIKGTTITYRGYVSSKNQLSAWEDPVLWLKAHGA